MAAIQASKYAMQSSFFFAEHESLTNASDTAHMKLYTRTGDDGSTGLFGGDRVGKDAPRIEAYGAVDELNAQLGHAIAAAAPDNESLAVIRAILVPLQSRLFDLGADLATPAGSKHEDKVKRMTAQQVSELENAIDTIDAINQPIRAFVMPGGTEFSARLHLARVDARRAERAMVALNRIETINPHAIVWINRLSDLFFASARAANAAQGVADVPWVP